MDDTSKRGVSYSFWLSTEDAKCFEGMLRVALARTHAERLDAQQYGVKEDEIQWYLGEEAALRHIVETVRVGSTRETD